MHCTRLRHQCLAGGPTQARQRAGGLHVRASSEPAPPLGRALGVDYGRRGVGLAVSTLGLAPRPLMTLDPTAEGTMLELSRKVVDIAKAEGCHGVVIGLPVTTTGSLKREATDSQQGRRCRNFAGNVSALAAEQGLPVYLIDERGTTMDAESMMPASRKKGGGNKSNKDSVAAALILARYYDEPQLAVFVRPLSF